MPKYNLGFIEDEKIFNHVRSIVSKYRFSINLKEFNKNLIDPIKLTFDSKVYSKKLEDIIESEILRQIDKSNTHHIGYFHQNIFKYINKDWSVPKQGFDIINEKLSIFVELKNKHNTMNSSSAQKTFMRMQNILLKNSQAQCFLVEVIAKKSQNEAWKVSLDGNLVSDNRIRKVSIDKFYELVTGDKLAFQKLCKSLPTIIDDVLKETKSTQSLNTVVNEFKEISSNLEKSIYLLAFNKYEGFGDF